MAKDIDCVLCGSCVVDMLVRPVSLDAAIGGGRLFPVEPIEVTTGGYRLQCGDRNGPAGNESRGFLLRGCG